VSDFLCLEIITASLWRISSENNNNISESCQRTITMETKVLHVLIIVTRYATSRIKTTLRKIISNGKKVTWWCEPSKYAGSFSCDLPLWWKYQFR